MGSLLATLRAVLPTSSIASEPEEETYEEDSRPYYYDEAPVQEVNYSNTRTEYIINEEIKQQYIREEEVCRPQKCEEVSTPQEVPIPHIPEVSMPQEFPTPHVPELSQTVEFQHEEKIDKIESNVITHQEVPDQIPINEKAVEQKAETCEKEIVQEIPKENTTTKEKPVEDKFIEEIVPSTEKVLEITPKQVTPVEETIVKEEFLLQESSPKEQERANEPEVDIDDTEDDSSRAKAAVKIQALYRGYTTRKTIEGNKTDTCHSCNSESDVCGINSTLEEINLKESEVEEHDSKKQKQVHFELNENEEVKLCNASDSTVITNLSNKNEVNTPSQENENITEDDELIEGGNESQPHKVEAAVKIQAAFRGHIVRKEMRKKNNPTSNIEEYEEEEEEEEEEETESQEISEEEILEEDEVIAVGSKGRCVNVNDDETF